MSNSSATQVSHSTEPRFKNEASEIALQLAQYPAEDLQQYLRTSYAIAVENKLRYQYFHADEPKALATILSYTGIVFKTLSPKDFSDEDFEYAQNHLRLTSFCYGLLRPLDRIKNYRLEGDVKLPEPGDETMFAFWKPRLTDLFIDEINRSGGVLVNLASNEMKNLFDWKRVEKSCRVISPDFKIWKNGKPSTVVVYTKMARGAMTRYILKNRIESVDDLKLFDWEGFAFDSSRSDKNKFFFLQL